ncbi:MAG: ArsR/SmtB family transcription factor [Flavisolibacter sp.]
MVKEPKSKISSKKELEFQQDDLKKAALVLRAINHKLRQRILAFIHKNGNSSVSEIYKKLRLEQSVTSQHLAVLRKAGFVTTERDGQNIYYSVNYSRLEQVHKIAGALIEKS